MWHLLGCARCVGSSPFLVYCRMLPASRSYLPSAAPLPDVLVFKTSVRRRKHVRRLSALLDAFGRWNFALDDCDRILRVETCPCHTSRICALLARYGFRCEELPD